MLLLYECLLFQGAREEAARKGVISEKPQYKSKERPTLGPFANILQHLCWNYTREEARLDPGLQNVVFSFNWGAKLRTQKLMENELGQVHQKERVVPAPLEGGGWGEEFSGKAVAVTVFIWKTKYNTQPLIKEKAGEKAGDASNETTNSLRAQEKT